MCANDDGQAHYLGRDTDGYGVRSQSLRVQSQEIKAAFLQRMVFCSTARVIASLADRLEVFPSSVASAMHEGFA